MVFFCIFACYFIIMADESDIDNIEQQKKVSTTVISNQSSINGMILPYEALDISLVQQLGPQLQTAGEELNHLVSNLETLLSNV